MKPELVATVALIALAGGGARAQAVLPSADQATALERQVYDALITAGFVGIAARPVEFTAEGDHYRVQVPLADLGPVEPSDAAVTMRVRPLDAGRWAIDDEQLPAEFKILGKLATPDAPDTKTPSPDGPHQEALTYVIKLGRQEGHGVFDPSWATLSQFDATGDSLDIVRSGASTHIARFASQTSIRPVAQDRADYLSDGATEGYVAHGTLPDGSVSELTAQTMHVTASFTGLGHDKLSTVLQFALATARLPPGTDDAARAGLRQMLIAASGLLTGGRIEESLTDLRLATTPAAGSIAKLNLAVSGDAPQDTLSATINFSIDGLVVDSLPPTFAAFVPTHFAIRPTLSNLNVADLTKIGMDATAPGDGRVPPADIEALFSHGGISLSFDTFGLDVVGAQFAGAGQFTLTGPQAITGQAELTAHGLDALIASVQTAPLFGRLVPAIIFLKGIAHMTGDQAVWQISVANQKVLVNGVDLLALAGAH